MLFVVADQESARPAADALTDAFASEDQAIEVRVTESYTEAREALCNGTAQVVSLDAFSYLIVSQDGCGDPLYLLEHNGELVMRSQMLTARGRGIFGVDGFWQRTYCRPDEFSVTGWIVPSLVLRTYRVDPFKNLRAVVDAGSDEEVIRMIYRGDCDVGATSLGAEANVEDLDDPDRIVILEDQLAPIPNDMVVLSSRLDELTAALLGDLLRQQRDDLAELLGSDALGAADDSDFDELRALFEAAGVDVAALTE